VNLRLSLLCQRSKTGLMRHERETTTKLYFMSGSKQMSRFTVVQDAFASVENING
jgi:hypothetical protein